MALSSATSVPGRSCRCSVASRAVGVRLGSTTMTRVWGAVRMRSRTRSQTTGWHSAMLAPMTKKSVACSMSS